MGKLEVPPGCICQAYRFEIDRPSRYRSISSHEGAKRFAWNWALELIEHQLHARDTYRLLALRQGATMDEAVDWSRAMVPVPNIHARTPAHLEYGEARDCTLVVREFQLVLLISLRGSV